MEEPNVITHMFRTYAMDDSIRGLAFDNRCSTGEIVHRAIQEYTGPTKKDLAALEKAQEPIRQALRRDIERLGIPFKDLPPAKEPEHDMLVRTLNLSAEDFNKVAGYARKEGVSRQVILRDAIQKHLDKNPRTP